jgi:hypothetical protein
MGLISMRNCKKDWVGLPAGVKFDPTDQELIEHLEAKVKDEGSRSHPLIDEFIPTIDGEDGICYTHPEKLPGERAIYVSKLDMSRNIAEPYTYTDIFLAFRALLFMG